MFYFLLRLKKIMSFSVGYIKKVLKRQDADMQAYRFSTFLPEIWC